MFIVGVRHMKWTKGIRGLFNTVYFQIILTFFAIIAALFLSGLIISNYGQMLVMEQISLSTLNKLEYFLHGIQGDLQNIQNMEFECINDIDFNKYALPEMISEGYQEYSTKTRIRRRLSMISSVSPLTENVSAYFLETKKMVVSSNFATGSLEDQEIGILTSDQYESGLYIVDGALRVFTVYPGLRKNGKDSLFVIATKMSNQRIAKALLEAARVDDEYVLLLHESGWQLNASGAYLTDEECSAISENLAGRGSGVEQFRLKDADFLISWYSIEEYGLKMVILNDMTVNRLYTNRFYLLFTVFTITFFFLAVFFVLFTRRLLQRPMITLVDAFARIQNKDFQYRITKRAPNEFAFIYASYNEMAGNIDELIETVYEAKILAQESEFKHLQAQINPHFLYNCFFLLNGQIQIGDKDTASEMARKLGRYFKYITHNDQARISLSNEYEHAITYSDIQMLRFGNRVFIEYMPLPERLHNIQVPRIIIQPLIENAFEHGVRENEAGVIRLSVSEKCGLLSILVEDNGDLDEEQLSQLRRYITGEAGAAESSAISNISKRLQIAYNSRAGITAEYSELGGLKITIWMETGGVFDV